MQVCSARRWRAQRGPSADRPGPRAQAHGSQEGQVLQARAVWEPQRGWLSPYCLPAKQRHARACENGCSRERVYLLSRLLCESGNWTLAGQVSKGRKPVTGVGLHAVLPRRPRGVSPALTSQPNPAPGNANGVNTSAGHTEDSSVCLMFTSLVFQQEPTPLFAL